MYRNRPLLNNRRPRPVVAVAVVTAFFLCMPLLAQAKGESREPVKRPVSVHDLEAPADFIEHAQMYDVDIHDLFFSLRLYEGTRSCLTCHEDAGTQALGMAHFEWRGKVENIVGLEGENLGKYELLNNFCVAVPSNEGRCTQCHTGLGWTDNTFDFNDPENVDCLVCHDQSGTYAKAPTTGGLPDPSVDLNAVARSVAIGAKPTRKACIDCHAKAGGGDNVKHGDLAMAIANTTREYDVHMGTDGGNLVCTDCHAANHNPEDGTVNHGIAGMEYHSVHQGEMRQCTDCHGSQAAIHAGSTAEEIFAAESHQRLACQVCHIPAIARETSTKVEWYWSDAGQNISPIPVDPDTGRPTYDKKKGTFVWKNDVRPTLRWWNGKWNRKAIGFNDTYDEVPIDLGSPVGSYEDPASMIYPFKLMVGNQPVDPVNKTVVVPHLFGMKGGPNPYWGKFDWNLAIQDGTSYAGQPYSGTFAFEDTFMLLTVNHEVAPAENALGMGGMGGCADCHDTGKVDWQALGWTKDPFEGGSRVVEVPETASVD